MNLELLLSRLLQYGTWVASLVIAAGMIRSDMRVVTWGIALFILLPVLRVAVMLGVFVHRRDSRFIAITALVLVIILAGFALGSHLSPRNG